MTPSVYELGPVTLLFHGTWIFFLAYTLHDVVCYDLLDLTKRTLWM